MQEHNRASAWFNDLYKENKQSQEKIPWARQAVNPYLQTYLEEELSHKGTALVIGCGLGDDAYALAQMGYEVTAIDVSDSAIEQANERFLDANISFKKQDIFEYEEQFYFVFEAFTIQSLPVEFREKMIKAVAQTVAPKGRLLLVAHRKEHDFKGPPYPLTLEEVQLFEAHGLEEFSREIYREASPISQSRFRVLFKRC